MELLENQSVNCHKETFPFFLLPTQQSLDEGTSLDYLPSVCRYCVLLLALFSMPFQASAFSLLGPFQPWQTPELGFNVFNTELGGPAELGQEFRWNTPIITGAKLSFALS
jgi:hypothetical protein